MPFPCAPSLCSSCTLQWLLGVLLFGSTICGVCPSMPATCLPGFNPSLHLLPPSPTQVPLRGAFHGWGHLEGTVGVEYFFFADCQAFCLECAHQVNMSDIIIQDLAVWGREEWWVQGRLTAG